MSSRHNKHKASKPTSTSTGSDDATLMADTNAMEDEDYAAGITTHTSPSES